VRLRLVWEARPLMVRCGRGRVARADRARGGSHRWRAARV